MTDIISDQVRSLRIRNLSHSFATNGNGILLEIGKNGASIISNAEKNYHRTIPESLKQYRWLSTRQCQRAEKYKTTLQRMSETDFDLIERCGYEVSLSNLEAYIL